MLRGTSARAWAYRRPRSLKEWFGFVCLLFRIFIKGSFVEAGDVVKGGHTKKRRARDGVLLFLIGLICGAFFELRPVGDAGGNGNFASRYPAHGSRRRDFLKKVAADL